MRRATTITSSSTGPTGAPHAAGSSSTDGRVTVVVTAPLPSGPLRVALRMDGENIVIEALGPTGTRRVGRFTDADAAAYRPVVARLAARGQAGTCPARMVDTGEARALILHLGSPATCAPRDHHHRPSGAVPHPQTLLATARTIRLRAAVPAARSTRPHGPCPPRPGSLPRPRVAAGTSPPARPEQDDPYPLPSLAVRPSARFGQPDDAPPRLTRDQRRRVMWATIGIAAALLLAAVLQHGASTAPTARRHGRLRRGQPDMPLRAALTCSVAPRRRWHRPRVASHRAPAR